MPGSETEIRCIISVLTLRITITEPGTLAFVELCTSYTDSTWVRAKGGQMNQWKKSLLCLVLLSVSSLTVYAKPQKTQKYYDYRVSVRPIETPKNLLDDYSPQSVCLNQSLPAALDEIEFNDIIAVGKQIWQIIQDNKPQWNNSTVTVSAIPRKVECWNNLTGWRRDQKSYQVVAKNLLGMEVIRFKYTVVYYYGGSYEDRGQYLANVTVLPTDVRVSWGYSLDSDVKVPVIQNLGSTASPIAGMEMRVNWKIKTVVRMIEANDIYLLQGDGQFKALN